jgi:Major Facilitator Superfamily
MTIGIGGLARAHQLLRAIAAQSASTFANQVVAFVIPWLVLVRTGSALNAGTVAFTTGVAAVVGTVGGGVIVDRIGARATSLLSDTLSFATVVVVPVALLADFLPLWFILVTQTLGILFDGPGKVARDTLIPTTARHDDIPIVRAASLKESLQSVALFVGPLAAGLLVAAVNASVTLLVAAAAFVTAVVLVTGIKQSTRPPTQPLTAGGAYRDLREGFSFLLHEPLLGPLTLLLTAWVAVYVPLSTIVLPAWFVFAGQSASTLGIFLGAQALGGILGELGFAAVGPRVRPYRWFVTSSIVSKVTLAALLFTTPGSAAAVAVAFLTGLTAAGQLPIINTAYYTRTPVQLLGRVNGAGWALVLAALPVASLGFGWLVNVTSPATGILTVVASSAVMIAIFCLLPAMRLVDHQQPDAAEQKQGPATATDPQPEPATA